MSIIMFNELPLGALFRVVNNPSVTLPFSHSDIFIKVRNSKGKYRAFNITANPTYFGNTINWDNAPIYPECTNWQCEIIDNFYKRVIPKTNVPLTTSARKRFSCVLGNSDWDMSDNAYLMLTDDQINLLEYLINETSVFDEDVGLMVIDTEFKAF